METKLIEALLNNPHYTNEEKATKINEDHQSELVTKRFWQRAYLIGVCVFWIVVVCVMGNDLSYWKEQAKTMECKPTNYSTLIGEAVDSTTEKDCRVVMYLEQVPLQMRKDICRTIKNQIKY